MAVAYLDGRFSSGVHPDAVPPPLPVMGWATIKYDAPIQKPDAMVPAGYDVRLPIRDGRLHGPDGAPGPVEVQATDDPEAFQEGARALITVQLAGGRPLTWWLDLPTGETIDLHTVAAGGPEGRTVFVSGVTPTNADALAREAQDPNSPFRAALSGTIGTTVDAAVVPYVEQVEAVPGQVEVQVPPLVASALADDATIRVAAVDAMAEAAAQDEAISQTMGTVAERTVFARTGATRIDPHMVRAAHAPAPLVTPTSDGSGQAVHPAVLYFPSGWSGYRYWMAMTPYPGGLEAVENPEILASQDGQTWEVPEGLTNPLDKPTSGFYPDVDLILHDGKLWLTYAVDRCKWSTDGVNWSPVALIGAASGANLVSQTLVEHEGAVHFWCVQRSTDGTPYKMLHRVSSGTVTGPWTALDDCTLHNVPAGRDIWHIQIRKAGDLFVAVVAVCDKGTSGTNTALHFATSPDGKTWTLSVAPILEKKPGHWASQQVYHSSIVPLDGRGGALFGLWYSAAGEPNTWHIGYTEIASTALTQGLVRADEANRFAPGQLVTGGVRNRVPDPSLLIGSGIVPAGWVNNLVGASEHGWDEAEEAYTFTISTSGPNIQLDVPGVAQGEQWTFSVEAKHTYTGAQTAVALTWLDAASAPIGPATSGVPWRQTYYGRPYVSSVAPAGAVKARLTITVGFTVAGTSQFFWRRAQFEKAASPTDYQPVVGLVERAVEGQAGNLHEWQSALGPGRGARVGAAVAASGRLKLPPLTANPTDAATVGELCLVNGVVKVCTVAGTPGTWTTVGTQT